MVKSLLVGIFSLLISNISFAQTPGLSVEMISTEQGLPDKKVNAITQDNAGFMWVGTASGLYRYDGYAFVNYTNNISGSGQQKAFEIHDLLKTDDGTIWICTQDGLYHFNSLTGKAVKKDLSAYTPIRKVVKRIIIDSKKRYWVYIDADLVCFDASFNYLFAYRFPFAEQAEKHIAAFIEDTNHTFWLISPVSGISHISENGQFIAHYLNVQYAGEQTAIKKIITKEGFEYHIYLGKKYDEKTIAPESDARNNPSYLKYGRVNVFHDKQGNEWEIAGENITLKDTAAKKRLPFALPYTEEFLYDFPTEVLYQSFDHTIWAGNRKGIFKMNYKRSPFHNYLSKKLSQPDAGISIRGMAEDSKGNIWIGHYPYSAEKIKLSVIRHLSDVTEPVILYYKNGQRFTDNSSPGFSLVADKSTLWHSSEGPYIAQTEMLTGKTIRYEVKGLDFPVITKAMIKRSDSAIFFITSLNMAVINPFLKNYLHEIFSRNGKKLEGYSNFIDAGKNFFWAIAKKGIYLFNDRGEILRSFTAEKDSPVPLPVEDVHHMYVQPGGPFWLGTRHGLLRLDTANKTTRLYTMTDGLPNNNVMGILPDEFGFLWMSTDNGLSRFNPVNGNFTNYDENGELPHHEFNRMAYLKASDGRLYFGGLNGVTAFYPKDVDTTILNLSPQLLAITKYDGKKDSVITVNYETLPKDKIVFNPKDKLFEFRFMLAAFRSPLKNKFQYKLEGWDKNWRTLNGSNLINYDYLSPGNYVLKVKGATAGDRWSDEEFEMKILVKRAWNKTWWFYTLLGFLVATAVYALYRYRINQVLKVQKMRNKISADLHDELGSVLTQISLQSEMVNSGIYNEKEKQKELKNIGSTSRRAIHAMSDIVWSVKAGNDKISSLIDRMRDHADLMLQPMHAVIDFTVQGMNEEKEMDNNLRQELFLIFKEAINNIVKHSHPSKVEINMGNQNGQFELMIKNDINQEKKNEPDSYRVLGGNGLENMKRRAQGIGANLETVRVENYFIVTLMRSAI